jgi:DNA-binding response OmpR family regulator
MTQNFSIQGLPQTQVSSPEGALKLKVLLLEDEPRVQNFVRLGLEHSGMSVDAVADLPEVDAALSTNTYDLVILDRMIGSQDSIHMIPTIRKRNPQMKILVLSALSEVVEKIHGLDVGADDYLGKPFHIEELVSRIRALCRRASQIDSRKLEFEDLFIDLETQKVRRGTDVIDLTAKEMKLLLTLTSRPGKVFSRAELLQRAWDMTHDPESNVVDVAVGRLKRKINKPGLPKLIHAKRGGGYYLGRDEKSV